MITRRDLIVAALAVSTTIAAVALAQTAAKPAMDSCVFDWDQAATVTNQYGSHRDFFDSRTATLDQFSCHVTTLNPGQSSHPPHRHQNEELVILKEGTLEVMQNGKTNIVHAGSMIFEASNQLHGVRNPGTTPAVYYVLNWVPPGGFKPKTE